MNSSFSVGIVGARGHTGEELLKILNTHPDVDVTFAGSRELAGLSVPEIPGLSFQNLGPDEIGRLELDALFLALPNEVGEPFASASPDQRVIVDISADHRFDDAWVYGIPELNRDKIAGARRVANPGCYATIIQLIVAPFVEELDGVPAVFGVSGHSGAGAEPSPLNDPEHLSDNLIPYKLVGHIHEREATRHLGHPIRFMPHVHPAFRGLLVTAHLPTASTSVQEVTEALHAAYDDEPLVNFKTEPPELRDGAGIPGVVIGGVEVSADGRNVVIVGAEDNLLKGAAVQAVQNLNLALGLAELTGIATGSE